jgi:signal transduction histidine kinase
MQDDVERLQAEVTALRRSRRRLVEAADADRRAIERTLHDGLQQNLVALAVDVQRLAGVVEGDRAAAKAQLEEMAANLREATTEAAALAQAIYPPLLDRRGFASSLRSAAEVAGVTVLVNVPAAADYPAAIGAAMYWSCVEVLASASAGSQATVTVRDEDGGLTFEVGIRSQLPRERAERLRDRIEALGGRLRIDDDDRGSRVHGWLPLSR